MGILKQRGCPSLCLPKSFHLESKVSRNLGAGGSKEGIHPVIKYLQRVTILSQAVKNTPTQIRVSLQRNLLTLLWHIYVRLRLFSCNNLELLVWHSNTSQSPVPSTARGRETKRCPEKLLRWVTGCSPVPRWWHGAGWEPKRAEI